MMLYILVEIFMMLYIYDVVYSCRKYLWCCIFLTEIFFFLKALTLVWRDENKNHSGLDPKTLFQLIFERDLVSVILIDPAWQCPIYNSTQLKFLFEFDIHVLVSLNCLISFSFSRFLCEKNWRISCWKEENKRFSTQKNVSLFMLCN